jgi:hypothetical protein
MTFRRGAVSYSDWIDNFQVSAKCLEAARLPCHNSNSCIEKKGFKHAPLSPYRKKSRDRLIMAVVSPVTSKPASQGRIKTGHSEVLNSYQFS